METKTDSGLMPGVVTVFAGMLLAVEIAEFSVRIPIAIGGVPQYWLMRFTPWFLASMLAIISWWAGKLGRAGMIAAIAAAGLSFIVITSYRGTYIWPGIFDLVSMKDGDLKIAFAFGVIAGVISHVFRTKPKFAPSRSTDIVAVGGLVLCGVIEWISASKFPIESQFAPLRHISLLVLCAVFSVFLVADEVLQR